MMPLKNLKELGTMNLNMEEEKNPPNRTEDSIVKSLIQKFWKRSSRGVEEYGTTLDQNKLPVKKWTKHLQEELMDASLYLEKIHSVSEISSEQIKEIKRNIVEQQNVLTSARRSIEDTAEIAMVSDLQPEFVDLLKSIKMTIDNAEWQLETVNNLASARYIRVLNKEDE